MAELPKQELLCKLLKMTTSSNDAEALVAMRKANLLLSAAGWNWEKLIAGKITVIADPFGSAPEFTPRSAAEPPKPSAAQAAASQRGFTSAAMGAAASRQQQRQPPPPPQPKKARINSTKQNLYAGYCYCCGHAVDQQAGYVFNPLQFVGRAKDKWVVVCDPCNQSPSPQIGASPAQHRRAPITSPPLGAL